MGCFFILGFFYNRYNLAKFLLKICLTPSPNKEDFLIAVSERYMLLDSAVSLFASLYRNSLFGL